MMGSTNKPVQIWHGGNLEGGEMECKEYLLFVGQRLERAMVGGDKKEWIRLAEVLIAVLREQIEKLKE